MERVEKSGKNVVVYKARAGRCLEIQRPAEMFGCKRTRRHGL